MRAYVDLYVSLDLRPGKVNILSMLNVKTVALNAIAATDISVTFMMSKE